jgi:hypothetical protein
MFDCAMYACFGCLHRIMLVMNGRSRTGEIVNLIDFDIQWQSYVVPDEFKLRLPNQMFDIAARSGKKIINAKNVRTVH